MQKSSDTMRISNLIAEYLATTDKTADEIAAECGFTSPATLILLSTGKAKLPFPQIKRVAKSLNMEPAQLLRLALAEYMPDVFGCIKECLPALLNAADAQAPTDVTPCSL